LRDCVEGTQGVPPAIGGPADAPDSQRERRSVIADGEKLSLAVEAPVFMPSSRHIRFCRHPVMEVLKEGQYITYYMPTFIAKLEANETRAKSRPDEGLGVEIHWNFRWKGPAPPTRRWAQPPPRCQSRQAQGP
jgi:hypothetical protein